MLIEIDPTLSERMVRSDRSQRADNNLTLGA